MIFFASLDVYFDQHLGAAHFKCQSNFSHFLHKNVKKKKKAKNYAKLGKKNKFSGLHQQQIIRLFLGYKNTLNQPVGASPKTLYCLILPSFSCFFIFSCKKHEKSIFQPLLGVQSTHTLVKIYNKFNHCLFICQQIRFLADFKTNYPQGNIIKCLSLRVKTRVRDQH